jgi:hypothetical protein
MQLDRVELNRPQGVPEHFFSEKPAFELPGNSFLNNLDHF